MIGSGIGGFGLIPSRLARMSGGTVSDERFGVSVAFCGM